MANQAKKVSFPQVLQDWEPKVDMLDILSCQSNILLAYVQYLMHTCVSQKQKIILFLMHSLWKYFGVSSWKTIARSLSEKHLEQFFERNLGIW